MIPPLYVLMFVMSARIGAGVLSIKENPEELDVTMQVASDPLDLLALVGELLFGGQDVSVPVQAIGIYMFLRQRDARIVLVTREEMEAIGMVDAYDWPNPRTGATIHTVHDPFFTEKYKTGRPFEDYIDDEPPAL